MSWCACSQPLLNTLPDVHTHHRIAVQKNELHKAMSDHVSCLSFGSPGQIVCIKEH